MKNTSCLLDNFVIEKKREKQKILNVYIELVFIPRGGRGASQNFWDGINDFP